MASYFGRTDKPEGALKRAQDLISVGNKEDALKLLHDVITAKRHHRQWQQTYEGIMLLYLELCVDLKEHRGAKDGLHQYRNMSQQHGGDSLEKVIVFYVELAERRMGEARKKADAAAVSAASATITDLENDLVSDPESIMLSTMTMDSTQERTERDVMVPWLRFLWETYRAVLEVLRTMQKLEKLYHSTCEKALAFCRTFERTREFHSLCETLSNHLGNLLKATHPLNVVPAGGREHKPKGWDQWTSESIEMHLQTRFRQLEVSDALKLWNEGFRIVEDIYTLMQIPLKQVDGSLARKLPKPRLMAAYYEKLTRIFRVSGNHLFHAYAWHKYYLLTREAKSFSAEEKQVQASTVLLAALCVPVTAVDGLDKGQQGDALLNEDLLKRKKKNEKIAALLDFNANPTRMSLLSEVQAKGVLQQVLPELKELYQRVEVDFAPLQLVPTLLPTLAFLRKHPKLKAYVAPLERLLAVRVLRQLAGVYHTVKMAHLKNLLHGLEIPFTEVEQLIVSAVKERQVKVRIDYRAQCLHFGEAELEGDSMRHQLQVLATQLARVSAMHLSPPDPGARDAARAIFMKKVLATMEAQHLATLARKETIERQKVDKERERQRRRELEQVRKAEEEKRRREHEAKRMEEEKRKREEEKKKKDEEALALESVHTKLKNMGFADKVDEMKDMDAAARKRELEELVQQQQNAKREEAKKQAEQAKRLDYAVRALRLHEQELVAEAYEKQITRVETEHAQKEAELDAERKQIWAASLALKRRFAPMRAFTAAFERDVNKVRRIDFEAHVARLRADYQRTLQGKIARARKRKADKEEREAKRNKEMEAIRKYEEERLKTAREERARYEAECEARGRNNHDDLEDDYLDEVADDDDYGPGHKRPSAGAAEEEGGVGGGREGGGGGSKKYVPPAKLMGGGGGAGGWRERQLAKQKEKEEAERQRKALLRERGMEGGEEGGRADAPEEDMRQPRRPLSRGEEDVREEGREGGFRRGPPVIRGGRVPEGGGWREKMAAREREAEGGGGGGGGGRRGGYGGGDRDGMGR